MIRSSLLDRFALEDSTEVYFVFFELYSILYKFRNSNKFPGIYIGKTNSEIEKQGTVVGPQFGPRPRPNGRKAGRSAHA
jgi:hypothetical protein